MKFRYYLKKQKAGPHPIYIALYQSDRTELIFTGQRIKITDWSIKDGATIDHSSAVSKVIEKVQKAVKKCIAKLEFEEQPVTPFSVKLAYMEELALKEHQQVLTEKKLKTDTVTLIKLAE